MGTDGFWADLDDILEEDGIFDDEDNGDPRATVSKTIPIGQVTTKAAKKLLTVILVIDCSRSMEDGKIQALNIALKELKDALLDFDEKYSQENLELKVAVMSFTANARWEMELTPIQEVIFPTMNTRAGLTMYGPVFNRLNEALSKERFMSHLGRRAQPAIIFLTDGEPMDKYEQELQELHENVYFQQANRSAVLLGEAIHSPAAREAVKNFVSDVDKNIVPLEKAEDLINEFKIVTQHTIKGNTIPHTNPDPEPEPIPNIDPIPDIDPIPNIDPIPDIDPIPNIDPIPDIDPMPGPDIFPDFPILFGESDDEGILGNESDEDPFDDCL